MYVSSGSKRLKDIIYLYDYLLMFRAVHQFRRDAVSKETSDYFNQHNREIGALTKAISNGKATHVQQSKKVQIFLCEENSHSIGTYLSLCLFQFFQVNLNFVICILSFTVD